MLPPAIAELYNNPLWIAIVSWLIETLEPVYYIANAVGTLLVMYYFSVYWKARLKKAEVEEEIEKKIDAKFDWMKERKSQNIDPRWVRIENLMKGTSASDWRIAILEADSIMDELIEKMGFPGVNMGERMKAMPKSAFPLLDSAWDVHRLRNNLAHEAGYALSKDEAENAIDTYHRIFKDTDVLPS